MYDILENKLFVDMENPINISGCFTGDVSLPAFLFFTRNTLDCDQCNYSSRIVFSHIPIEFVQTGNSAIRSADPENSTVEPNLKWIGRPLAEIWPFEIFPNVRSSVGRSSRLLLKKYTCTAWARGFPCALLFVTLGT